MDLVGMNLDESMPRLRQLGRSGCKGHHGWRVWGGGLRRPVAVRYCMFEMWRKGKDGVVHQ